MQRSGITCGKVCKERQRKEETNSMKKKALHELYSALKVNYSIMLSILRKKTWCILFMSILMFSFFFLADPVHCQEISLEQAIELFYKNNYDIIINRYEIDKSYGDYVAAKIIPNPSMSVNFTGYNASLNRTDFTQQIFRIDQLLEIGGKRGYRIKTANEALEAMKLTHKDTIRNLLSGFYSTYYNLVLDELSVEFAKEEVKRFDQVLNIAEKRYNAGFLSLIDYTKLKLAKIELENSLTIANTQYKNDLTAFNLLLGGGASRPAKWSIKEEFPEYNEDTLLEKAYATRFDLLSLERQIKSAEFGQKLARAQRIPDITLGAQFERLGQNLDQGRGAGINMSIPLFYRNQGEILKKDAEFKQIQTQLNRVKQQILTDIKQALNNYIAGLAVLDVYKKRKNEIGDLLERSEKAFSIGGITVLDLIDTRKTYRDFFTKYNHALTQAMLNKELVKISTGEIK
jgi:outer membrane protein, heavy metal efflux system